MATAGAASAGRPAILPGYRPWDAAGILSRHKRKLIVAFFIVTFFYSAFFQLMPRAMAIPLLLPVAAIWMMIIWALPVLEYRPARILSGLFWAYYCALFLWPNYLAVAISGLPWITVARLFCAPMVALLLVYVSNCGPFRREMKEILAPSRTLVRFVAAFAAIQFLATFFSSSPFDTLNRMINNQIIWTAIFFVAAWTFRKRGSIELWFRIYLVLSLVLCALAELEARKQGVLWANSIPAFLAVQDESVQRLLAGAYRLGSVYRVIATATTPLSLAEILGAASPFVLFAMVQYKSLLLRIALGAFDILLIYVISLTDSRLGMAAMLVGHAGYMLYLSYRIYKFHPNPLIRNLPVVIYPVLVVAMAAAVLFVGRINNAIIGDGRQQFSDASRATQISDGLVKIWQSPLFGFGAGQGGQKLGFTNAGGTLTIDSYYLSILLDYGFIGFFVFYGMMMVAIAQGAKIAMAGITKEHHLGAALSIFLLVFLVTKAVLSQEANHPLIFMAMGAVVGLKYLIQADRLNPGKTSI